MLKFYRKNIKVFIWLIILSFLGWGIGTLSLSTESAQSHIGLIGKEKISHKEFMTTFRYYDLLSRVENPIKEDAKEKESKEPPPSFEELKALTWQVIALSRIAKKEGISVNDQDVRKEIERTFAPGGQFDARLYNYFIENSFKGRARDFEEAIRKHLIVQRTRDKVLKDVPEQEREARWVSWLGAALNAVKITDYSQEQAEE